MSTTETNGSRPQEDAHPAERVRSLAAPVGTAPEPGETVSEARTRHLLGLALLDAGELDRADTEFAASLALAEDGDRSRAKSLECRGLIAQRRMRHEEALSFFDLAERAQGVPGRPAAVAVLDLLRGRSLVTLGRFDHALERLDAALEVFAAPGGGLAADTVNIAKVRLEKGRALAGLRRTDKARDTLELALAEFEERGRTYQTARARETLGGVARLRGEREWEEHLVQAARLYQEAGKEDDAARVRAHIG